MAGDVGGHVRGEEEDDLCDFFGCAGTTQRDAADETVMHLLRQSTGHVGVDISGAALLTGCNVTRTVESQ